MKFAVLTLFPDMITQGLVGLVGTAKDKSLYDLSVCDLRSFGKGVHKALDDVPYGGGDGMLLQAEPLKAALDSVRSSSSEMQKASVVYLSPKGQVWNQQKAWSWAQEAQPKILICGRYAGLDQRFIDECCDEEISIGDYILNGGELAALVVMESVIRLRQGTLGNAQSILADSLSDNKELLLEAPQYTRPRSWLGRDVPEILLSGHHEHIQTWARSMALLETGLRRPDLLTAKTALELKGLLYTPKASVAQLAALNSYSEDQIKTLRHNLQEVMLKWSSKES